MRFHSQPAAALLMLCLTVCALGNEPKLVESTSSRFDFAHHLLQTADESYTQGDPAMATVLYGEALKEYEGLIRAYPAWDAA
ncbi:MAG: hypothetical protein O3B24_03375, partial [Verrucomicrobia bacterium]|nr:hypothetical protein [Verrucomicrobiota bacterium]